MAGFKNHQITKHLRLIAFIGVIAAALLKVFSISEISPNQYYSFYALALIVLGVFVSIIILGRTAFQALKNPDLFVPVGLYLTADTLAGLGLQTSSFVGFRDGRLDMAGLSVVFVAGILLQLAIGVCFTGWMTRIILRFVQTEKVDLIASFRGLRWWFPRTLCFVVLGWLPVYLLLGVIFQPALAGGNTWTLAGIITPFLFIMAAFALVWNLATALVLPFVLSVQTNLKEAFVEGVKFSWARKKKTILPILLLMITAGWIVLISVSYAERNDGAAEFGETVEGYSNSRLTRKFNYSTNFIWIGDYPESSGWHKELLKAVKEEPLAPVDFRIALLMLFLSLVVNLKIIGEAFGAKRDAPLAANKAFEFNKIPFNPAVAAGLMIMFLPLEIITQNIHPRNLFSSKPTRIPETAQVIRGEALFNKQKIFEVGPGNTVSAAQKADNDKFEIRGINDIAAGNLDGEPGTEIVIATGKGTLILHPNGELKKEIPYQLEKSGEDGGNNHFSNQKIVDIGGDGVCEVINYENFHAPNGIYDLQGKPVLEFAAKESEETTAILATGDLDGRRVAGLFSISGGAIKPFQLEKGGKINAVFAQNIFVFDDERSGNLKVLTNQGQAVIKDGKGEILKKATTPVTQYGYLVGPNKEPLSIFFGGGALGLFDLDGKLKAKYDAPLSTEKYGYFEGKDNTYGSDLKVSIFKAEAFEVRFQKDKPPFIAVMAYQSRESLDFTSMLYIYNSERALLYQELFNAVGTKMFVTPSETGDGSESLMITADEKIWRYTTQ